MLPSVPTGTVFRCVLARNDDTRLVLGVSPNLM